VKLNRSPFAWFVLVLAVLGVFAAMGSCETRRGRSA